MTIWLLPDSAVHRFADFDIHPYDNNLLVCIREDHTDESQVTNGLVLINLKYGTMQELGPARVDGFYAFPRFGGRHGDKIAWIEVSSNKLSICIHGVEYAFALSGITPICHGMVQSSTTRLSLLYQMNSQYTSVLARLPENVRKSLQRHQVGHCKPRQVILSLGSNGVHQSVVGGPVEP